MSLYFILVFYYHVIQNATLITDIVVAWPGAGLEDGDPARVILWNDPNLDGNPKDAQVIVSFATTIQLKGSGSFVSVNIPDTIVGNSFFGTTSQSSCFTVIGFWRRWELTPSPVVEALIGLASRISQVE